MTVLFIASDCQLKNTHVIEAKNRDKLTKTIKSQFIFKKSFTCLIDLFIDRFTMRPSVIYSWTSYQKDNIMYINNTFLFT